MSSCCRLYCLTSSSRTFFNPSEFVWSAGVTSFTVFSTKTPLIIRKHLRSGGRGVRVSSTSLFDQRMSGLAGKVFASETLWSKVLKARKLLTCVLQYLVRCPQSSGLIVEDCFCSWCIAAAALAKAVSSGTTMQYGYIPCCFLTVICDCAITSCQAHHRIE